MKAAINYESDINVSLEIKTVWLYQWRLHNRMNKSQQLFVEPWNVPWCSIPPRWCLEWQTNGDSKYLNSCYRMKILNCIVTCRLQVIHVVAFIFQCKWCRDWRFSNCDEIICLNKCMKIHNQSFILIWRHDQMELFLCK